MKLYYFFLRQIYIRPACDRLVDDVRTYNNFMTNIADLSIHVRIVISCEMCNKEDLSKLEVDKFLFFCFSQSRIKYTCEQLLIQGHASQFFIMLF